MNRRVPLLVAFTLALQGCPFIFGCGGQDDIRDLAFPLSEEELRQLITQSGAADPPEDADVLDDTDTEETGATDTADLDTDLDTDSTTVPPFEGEIVVEDLDCAALCDARISEIVPCSLVETPAEATPYTLTCTVEDICVGGRMHAVIQTTDRASGPDPIAQWLAQAAHDEAASVHAFLALANELASHGAPTALRHRVVRAARDEVRHARTMADLARARGGVVPTVEVGTPTSRSLEAMALENAVEATVFETWSALSAWHQANAAADPELRAAMRTIADDETRHAELARDLHTWFLSQLDDDAIARVEAARDAAIAALRARMTEEPAIPGLGLPRGAQAASLLSTLEATIWR